MGNLVGKQFGNYRLTRFLDDGAYAEVYLGEHKTLRTQVAVKVQKTSLAKNQISQFQAEATTIAKLTHPHIVRVFDFGVEGNTPFMVMDYATNGTLRHRYPSGTSVPLQDVVSFVKQAAEALQYAHNEKLIHRDVKPENMLLGPHNQIWLSDFGIAVIAHSTHSMILQDKVGTLEYMAPEQLQGKPVLASDQYSLGIVAYEWLCGETPFHGTMLEILTQHLSVAPPSLCTKAPKVPHAVERVVFKALAKDPHQRFSSVQEFASALEKVSMTYNAPTISTGATYPPNLIMPPTAPHISPKLTTAVRVGTTHYTYKGSSSGQTARVATVAWIPNEQKIVLADPTQVHIINIDTKDHRAYNFSGVTCLTLSSDGYWIASSNAEGVQVWSESTGTIEFTYGGHFDEVTAISWSSDGKHIISSDRSGEVHIWDVTTGYTIFSRKFQPQVNAVSWSQDGICCVTGDDIGHQIAIYKQSSSGKFTPYYKLTSYNIGGANEYLQYVHAFALSYKGERVAFGGYSTHFKQNYVCVFDAPSGPNLPKLTLQYSGHRELINTIAWSPVHPRIASGSYDSTIQVWNDSDGQNVFTYRGHSQPVTALAWSRDGKSIVSSDEGGTVLVWQAT